MIDRLPFSQEHDPPELSPHFSGPLAVVGPGGRGGHDLRISLGAGQETEPALGDPNGTGLNKEVGTCKVSDRAGGGDMVE